MWRSILGVVLGVIAGGLTVFLVEVPGYFVHPPPAGMDWNDPAQVAAHVAKAPPLAHLFVALAWGAGPLVASFVTGLIARRSFLLLALIVAAVFVLLDVSNYGSFPHPLWLMIAGVVLPPVTAWIGGILAAMIVTGGSGGPKPYDMREKNMAC